MHVDHVRHPAQRRLSGRSASVAASRGGCVEEEEVVGLARYAAGMSRGGGGVAGAGRARPPAGPVD